MIKSKNKKEVIRKKHSRLRSKIFGTTETPRLAVYKSNKHIYAQIIDDVKGVTLVSSGTVEGEVKSANGGNVEAAKLVGKTLGEKAVKAGITNVVFDRGGFLYHGRISALADAAREAGLVF